MMENKLKKDREIIRRYTGQPERLPADVRVLIEREWNGDPVQLYSFVDLDSSMQLADSWLALGPRHVCLAVRSASGENWSLNSFERDRVAAIREVPGLSGSTLYLLDGEDGHALAVVRYTNRQRRAVENIRFILDEQLEGRSVTAPDADGEYAGGVASPIRDAQALVAGNRMAVIWRLVGQLKPYARQLWVGFGAAGVITLVSLVPPYLAGYLIDNVVRPVQDGTMEAGRGATVAWIAISAMAVVYLVRQASALVRLRLMAVLGELVARDLRTALYEHLQKLSMSFYTRKKTGSIITRVSSDTDRLWDFLAFGIVDVSLSTVMLIGLGAVLLKLDLQLGLVMIAPVPLFCWAIFYHGELINRVFVRAWRKWSHVTDVLSDTIPGMRVVKAFNQEDRELEKFKNRNVQVTDEFNRIHRIWTTFWPALMLTVHATTVGVWVFAMPRLLGQGGDPLSAGTFVSFLLYTTMFIGPIEVIGQMARTVNRATSSAHRVFEILDTEPEIVDTAEPVKLTPVEGRVTFENVTFGYDGVRQVLRGVSFDVAPGEMIGLVGGSGGGKTTIVNLVARFYDATGGVVKIDGVDIRELDTGHYRNQIGMVLQDPYLFHGTVMDNIRYGTPEASLEDVIAAAGAANAHEFICKMAHAYDTVVGERGQTLSGGERQRVSIARAILHNPRILILDEATSAVDSETERNIQDALDHLVEGRTVFAIAHRLSTLRKADRLFVIDDGRIVERGTHLELLEKEEGRYRRLYSLQRELAT